MFSGGVLLNIIFSFLFAGIICGLIYDLFYIFKFITKQNILVINILDMFCALLGGFLLIYCVFKFKYGEFALFEVLLFVFGIIFEQIIVKNLWTSPIKWVYNKITLRKIKKDFSKE